MTFYAGLTYLTSQTGGQTSSKNYQQPSHYISATQSGWDILIPNSVYIPTFINSNNSVLPSAITSYSGDYSNYVIVNNSSNNWALTLPLGVGGGTTAWRTGTFQITIKKTGSGTLTIQTPADTAGTRVRGINTTSNKSYTLSSSSAQSITLLYTAGYSDTGSSDSTAEIWHIL